jgi:hypothetical protein
LAPAKSSHARFSCARHRPGSMMIPFALWRPSTCSLRRQPLARPAESGQHHHGSRHVSGTSPR